MDLKLDIIKAQDRLQEIIFTFMEQEYTFYFRYLTLLEKVRIEQMAIKLHTTNNLDGTTVNEYKKQDHLIPVHTIIEKSLGKDGKMIFSHTNPEDFKTVSMLPAGLASMIAYQMSLDLFGAMKPKEKSEDVK